MGCLLFPFELIFDGVLEGWFCLMQWIDTKDNEIDYMTVYYTINGKVLEADKKDIKIIDSTKLSVAVGKDYAPNEQKTQDYFIISVYGILLPYELDESFTTATPVKHSQII